MDVFFFISQHYTFNIWIPIFIGTLYFALNNCILFHGVNEPTFLINCPSDGNQFSSTL